MIYDIIHVLATGLVFAIAISINYDYFHPGVCKQ